MLTLQRKETMKNSNDLMPITLLMSYLLFFMVFIIVLLLGAALQEETDEVYYERPEQSINN